MGSRVAVRARAAFEGAPGEKGPFVFWDSHYRKRCMPSFFNSCSKQGTGIASGKDKLAPPLPTRIPCAPCSSGFSSSAQSISPPPAWPAAGATWQVEGGPGRGKEGKRDRHLSGTEKVPVSFGVSRPVVCLRKRNAPARGVRAWPVVSSAWAGRPARTLGVASCLFCGSLPAGRVGQRCQFLRPRLGGVARTDTVAARLGRPGRRGRDTLPFASARVSVAELGYNGDRIPRPQRRTAGGGNRGAA
jgi:hypothetical protein